MYRELEPEQAAAEPGQPAPEDACECNCAEPAPAGRAEDEETPVGNRTAVQIDVHYDIGG